MANRQRPVARIEYQGQHYSQRELAAALGMSRSALQRQLYLGKSVNEIAHTRPVSES